MLSNTKKLARDGRTLTLTHTNVPAMQLMEFGLSEDAAKRAMRVRTVLPYMEDATVPCIDARKLWSRIGKPHKRFNDWANYHIKPLVDSQKHNTEISVFEIPNKQGKPSKNYTLSRDLAAKLAMQANTEDGNEIRCYFLDMERIVRNLERYNLGRAVVPVKLDNRLTHAAYKRNPEEATSHEKMLKSNVCKVLTGLRAGEVRLKYRMGIRDVLKNYAELQDTYNDAYKVALTMYEDGKKWRDSEPILVSIYGGKINLNQLQVK
ncbi:antA/AntB antirepressor family protein [Methylotenera sp. L2L1]|uniref:antA/AntB antirepressor family protein n=1 Tax=Methylotenera sp. L2L1 TaxID=1502770 RepID=UPI00056A94B3|nr:antA/AntB antirepressor family protein [Methylotenera sp. L2L1]